MTTIPGPVLILGLPLTMAVLLQLLRRWTTVTAWLAAVTSVVLGTAVISLPLTQTWQLGQWQIRLGAPLWVLGREVVLQPVDRLPVTFLFFTAAGIFILAWRLLPHSNFFPIGLATTALLVGALLVTQVVYAALLVEIAAILAVFPLHEGSKQAKGGLRFMTYTSLALPGLMVTQLLLDLYAIFPNDRGLLSTSAVLLSLSFAILLGAFPFQNWLSAVTDDGSPPVVTYIFTMNLGVVWFMLLAYLQSYTWLSEQAALGSVFNILGLLMMGLGGLLAASQQRLGRLVGYATLVDNGAMLLALGTQRIGGIALAGIMLISRPLALGLMTVGLAGLRRLSAGDDDRETLRGAVWRAPWRTAAFLVGGIALAGFPLSLGFTARWGLYRLIAEQSLFEAAFALLSSAGVMLGLISAMRALLAPPPVDKQGRVLGLALKEDLIVVLLIVVLIGATFTLSIFPQGISRVALEMASGYTFFAP